MDGRAEKLLGLMAQGMTQKAAGSALGMKEAAVSKCLKRWREENAKDIALNPATSQVLQRELNELENLIRLIERTEAWIQRIIDYLEAPEGAGEYEAWRKVVRLCGKKDNVHVVLLSFSKEQRAQVDSHFAMRKEYASMQAVVQFQSVVLDEIKKADPATAQRIAQRLADLRNLREVVDMVSGGV